MTTMANKVLDISWAQFEVCNANQQVSFENMCRWLFNVTFFDGKALLLSDPNNPGIEVLPELCLTLNKNISFQSKYFSTNVDYSQIKKSAKKAIDHYSGKLDIIYLYCNKDVTTSCKQYLDIEKMLNKANIEIIPVCNQAILEQVMSNESIIYYICMIKLKIELINLIQPIQNSQMDLSKSGLLQTRFSLNQNSLAL